MFSEAGRNALRILLSYMPSLEMFAVVPRCFKMGHVFLLLGFTYSRQNQVQQSGTVRHPGAPGKHPSDLKVLTTGVPILTFRKMEKVVIKIKLQH